MTHHPRENLSWSSSFSIPSFFHHVFTSTSNINYSVIFSARTLSKGKFKKKLAKDQHGSPPPPMLALGIFKIFNPFFYSNVYKHFKMDFSMEKIFISFTPLLSTVSKL